MDLMETNPIGLLFIALVICAGFYFAMEAIRRGKGIGANFDIRDDVAKATKALVTNDENSEQKVFLGRECNSGKEISVSTSTNHFYVAGTTGSGKSVALSNFFKAVIEYDLPMFAIDGKGAGNGSLLDILNILNTGRKIYVIDLNNPQQSDHYNPFKGTSATVAKDMLINLSDWSEEHYKLNTERYLQHVIGLMEKLEIPLSLKSIVDNIPADKFQVQSKMALTSGTISKNEHLRNLEIAKTSGKIAEEASARFSTIIDGELGVIFDEDGTDIISALRERAIILFVLNPLMYPELSARVAKLAIVDCKKAVSHLFREAEKQSFFVFDEVNVYCSEALLDLVNKSRAAKVTCVLASQTLSDLDVLSPHFKNQILENCNNYLILRQNTPDNAETWANTIGTHEVMNVTYQLHMDDKSTSDTGAGTAKRVREYIYHPDEIKSLKTGEAFFINKNSGFKTKIKVNKPF